MSIPTINSDLAKLGLSRDLSGASNTGATGKSASTKIGQGANSLDVSDFLSLMVAQFKNQDPTKPVDNAQFIAQLASFSTVAGIGDLNKSMGSLSAAYQSNQTLQAANLLGRNVLVARDTGYLSAGGQLGAAVDVPAGSQRVAVQIKDSAGALVRTVDLGSPATGLAKFTWDGLSDTGAALPAGRYSISAQSLVAGKAQGAPTYVDATVQSVTMGGGAGTPITVSLVGLGDVTLADVKQIS